MSYAARVAVVGVLVFLANVPFGYWRGHLRKLSLPWFVAIHAGVPLVILFRAALGLDFRWANVPIFAAFYFAGQFAGMRLYRRRRNAAAAEEAGPA